MNRIMQVERPKNIPSKAELQELLPRPKVQVAWLVLTAAFVWFHWGSIVRLVMSWWSLEDYQHGFFVPLFSLFVLWTRREMMVPFSGRGSWWGLPFFGLWALMRCAAVYFNYGTLPELSMLPFFAGIALFVGGWQALLWSWPAILFLFFMIPLPGTIQGLLSEQLQMIATRVSLYTIQMIGVPAVAQGNVIQLTDHTLGVAEACSGLRMMMLFFAMCVGGAFVMRKPVWERLLIVASAAPIAVLANVARIVATALAFEIGRLWPSILDLEAHSKQIHDWAGYVVEMPAGLLLLLVEVTILAKLLVEPFPDRPLVARKAVTDSATQGTIERTLVRRRR